MIGSIVVADYRGHDLWRRARFAVCAVLDVAKPLSHLAEHTRLAEDIDRFSVSILNNLAQGFEGKNLGAFLNKTLESVDQLDRALRQASEQHVMENGTSLRLQRELKAVRRALRKASRES
jgi:four helix bundle protein